MRELCDFVQIGGIVMFSNLLLGKYFFGIKKI